MTQEEIAWLIDYVKTSIDRSDFTSPEVWNKIEEIEKNFKEEE